MALLLLLPLLVSGFLLCLKDPLVYYTLHRYEGQLLYLQVGRFGIYCVLMAFAIMGLLSLGLSHDWVGFTLAGETVPSGRESAHTFSTDFLAYLGQLLSDAGLIEAKNSQATVFGILTGLLTLVMPRVWAARTLRSLRKDIKSNDERAIHTYLTKETLRHSPIGSTLVKAFAYKSPVMVCMDDRKVYVGLIQSLGAPTEVTGLDLEIELLPGLSGYRDKDTLEVKYTNTYPTDLSSLEAIALKQENVISIRIFSTEIKKVFEADMPEKSTGVNGREETQEDQQAPSH